MLFFFVCLIFIFNVATCFGFFKFNFIFLMITLEIF